MAKQSKSLNSEPTDPQRSSSTKPSSSESQRRKSKQPESPKQAAKQLSGESRPRKKQPQSEGSIVTPKDGRNEAFREVRKDVKKEAKRTSKTHFAPSKKTPSSQSALQHSQKPRKPAVVENDGDNSDKFGGSTFHLSPTADSLPRPPFTRVSPTKQAQVMPPLPPVGGLQIGSQPPAPVMNPHMMAQPFPPAPFPIMYGPPTVYPAMMPPQQNMPFASYPMHNYPMGMHPMAMGPAPMMHGAQAEN